MSTVGRQVIGQTGRPLEVLADGRGEYQPHGITIDWSLIPAVIVSTILGDDTVVPIGGKFLRYGQVMCKIGIAEVGTFEWNGGPTSGAAILTLPATNALPAQSTTPIAFNATAAEFQAALVALSRIGPNGVVVSRAGAGSAGSPYVYTSTYDRGIGDVGTFTFTHTFLGGTTPTVVLATTTPGQGTGKWGPYDPAAVDGRAVLQKGYCSFLNHTVLESELGSDHPGSLIGGLVYKARVLMTSGAASLAAGPTVAAFDTAFPHTSYFN